MKENIKKSFLSTPLPGPLQEGSLEFEPFYCEATKYLPLFEAWQGNAAGALAIIASKETYKEKIKALDGKYQMNFSEILKASGFDGKEAMATFVISPKVKRVFLFILQTGHEVRDLHDLGAKISNALNIAFETAILENIAGLHGEEISQVCFGIALRNYRFDKYFEVKKEGKGAKLEAVFVASLNSVNSTNFNEENLKELLEEKMQIARHNMLVRDLVNTGPGDLNPKTYSNIILKAFEGLNVKVKVLEEEEMRALGMNALLAVGHGSVNRPRAVVMEYLGNPDSNEIDFAIIGKGVCFDSGGYSIKPADGMETMKCDMAGSAVAFAALRLISKMRLKVNLVSAVGLVENLVDSAAYKPGDVLRSMSGQTIEVLNTDAEGRLVLADVLYYTQKNYRPKYMVDLATLTGAVGVALGDVYAGLMYNSGEIASMIEKSGEETGEISWRLPFAKEYDKMIDSTLADVKNIGSGRGAGTITAGQFLKRFVNFEKEWDAKWAHLDIAYVAFDGKGGADPKVARGGTGWGVHLLYKVIKNLLALKK